MKKHIILLSAAGLLFSSCGVYTKYKPATEVPDGLYGEEIATFTESTDGSPVAPEDRRFHLLQRKNRKIRNKIGRAHV